MMKGQLCRIFSLICLFFGWYTCAIFSQLNEDPKEAFLEAESYFLYEEFNEALPLYQKLKDEFPDNFNLDYRIGCCYLHMPYDLSKSVSFLETAVKHISQIQKEGNFKETQAPVDAWFYLGDAYRINNQLDKAVRCYNKFKQLVTNENYDLRLVNNQIKACERAVEYMKHPIDFDETNLGNVINTRFAESNPVVSEDETMLVYASRLPFYEAVYYSRKKDGKWSNPINMLPELGIDGDCFPTSISPDGTELYIYRSNEFLGDLYVSYYKNDKWSKIRKLNGNINTKYWESHACISHDGKTLYFTSNRKGGYGELDIYKSTRPSVLSDDWSIPVNMGPVINSPYNEDTPFITANDKRLYFSSYGHETMGGYDIFYSNLTSENSWTKPVNLGYPINTTFDEIFFNPVKDGSFAYMSKYDRNGFGRHDIVRYEIYSEDYPRKYLLNGKVSLNETDSSNNQVEDLKNLSVIGEPPSVNTNSNQTISKDDLKKAKTGFPMVANGTAVYKDSLAGKRTNKILRSSSDILMPIRGGYLFALVSGLIVLFIFIFIFVKGRKNSQT